MTRYIPAYDTENPLCLPACRKIVEIHRKHDMPGTFFIVGKTLQANPREYHDLLDDPLFEVGSHTWSHRMLRDHPFCGPAPSEPEVREEVVRGKDAVEQVFQRPCVGLRPGCGFVDGLAGAPHPLRCAAEAGFRYVSSMLWGPDYSLPAPLRQGFTYEADGFPEMWELPGHGWHENLLKDNNGWGARRVALWPSIMPEAIPTDFVHTPEEETAVNRIFLEKAKCDGLHFVSLIWHPWSLYKFDPEMRMLDQTFALAKELGLIGSRYVNAYQDMATGDGREAMRS